MEPSIVYLDAPIRNYAWGSHETIAGMMGRATPTPEPEAEIWYGAHPVAPSMVGRETGFVGLDNYIASDPRAMLGSRLLDEQGDQLPFLLKILAVERPLSIQAHPDKALARRGFMEETRRRVPLTAPQRIYRDPRPKPELVCALTPFDALVGFRPAEQLESILAAWGMPNESLDRVVAELLRGSDVGIAARAWAERNLAAESFEGEAARIYARLAEIYPDDSGLPVAMLLNSVTLQPGEALFLGPGLLHAYLKGTAVEVMGNSDNTLRGGLTRKYIDIPGLMQVVEFTSQPPAVLQAEGNGPEQAFTADTDAFRLSRIQLDEFYQPDDLQGPDILLCVDGDCMVSHGRRSVGLGPGEACFIPDACKPFTLSGQGTVFRARAGI